MFNNKKENNKAMASAASSTPSGINSLGSNTKIQGDLDAGSDIRLDGILMGNLNCTGKLILGPKGSITGEINCTNAVIEGSIEGVLRVKEHLHVKESARITGEISTNKLTVQSGAIFNVKCDMGGQTIAPKAVPQMKTA